MKKLLQAIRSYASKAAGKPKSTSSIESLSKSLSSKGFLRPHKSYSPSNEIVNKVQAICSTLQIPNSKEHKLSTMEEKFKLLNGCHQELRHNVPNSQLHEIKTIG